MPRVLVAGKLHPSGLDLLRAAPDVELEYTEAISTESMLPTLYSVDALLIRTQPLPASEIYNSPHLKIVSRHGVGYDAVAVEALNERGIPLAIVGDVNSVAVAEHTIMLMLAAAKQLQQYRAADNWDYRNSLAATELSGKTLLLAGFGRIGRRVAALAQAFDMQVYACDPMISADDMRANGVTPVDELASALPQADFISVHVPGSDKPLIGEAEFNAMKSSAILINTARGGIVDETVLTGAVRQKRIGAAGLDVFENEPVDSTHALAQLDNVYLTPHSAAMTAECAERMAVVSAQNIIDFFKGELDSSLVVNTSHCATSLSGMASPS